MKSPIGFVVIALATATAAIAQPSDPAAVGTTSSFSQSVHPGANAAAPPQRSGVRASSNTTTQHQVVKTKSRAEQDQAEARITAQLNRQQLVNASSVAGSSPSRPLPQTATRPSDCPSDQPSCMPDMRAPQ